MWQGSVEVRPDEDPSLEGEPQSETQPEGAGGGGGAEDVEIEVEGAAETGGGGETDHMAALERENRELKRQILEIGNSLKELRAVREEPKPKPPDEGAMVSPEQIAALIKEHGHDPEAMARIIDYVTEQKARAVAMDIRDKTMQDVSYRTWYQEQKRANDRIVQPYYQTNPDIREAVVTAVKHLGFEGHPLGELAVVAMMEMARAEQAREAAEATRAKELGEKKGLDKTRGQAKKTVGLTKSQMEVARELGLDPKVYAKFLGQEGS